jgi:DNA polymerase-3 subunit epsilon
MKNLEYAIVDIETTGGNAGSSRITEVAIIIHDGVQIIDRFETLVNPQKEIPFSIFALTGINNETVANAPIFNDIATKVFELLNDRVFVAHNVNFDYSFIRHQLEESGFQWTARKLCTVRASRKIRPGFPSYSLGNLCRSLEIPLENRHRAGGDADATTLLFSKLLAWDTESVIDKMIKKTSTDQRLPPNLPPKDFEQLPEKPGIYYFYGQDKKVIYVGKAINIKKRVASHFSGHKVNSQRQNFLRDIYGISFEVCATELMALLLECTEIKKLWPVYNRALKNFEPKFGLYDYEARNGYRYIAIGKLTKFQNCVQVFYNEFEAMNCLRNLQEKFEIDHRFCKYGKPAESIFFQANQETALPELGIHNQKITNALDFLVQTRPTFAIIDKGRTVEEKSCILVENGDFYGMGYFSTYDSITEFDVLKDHVSRYQSNQYIIQLLYTFAKKFPARIVYQKNYEILNE